MFEADCIIPFLAVARTGGVRHLPDRDFDRLPRGGPAPGRRHRGPARRGFPWRHFAAPAAVLAGLFLALEAVSRWDPLG